MWDSIFRWSFGPAALMSPDTSSAPSQNPTESGRSDNKDETGQATPKIVITTASSLQDISFQPNATAVSPPDDFTQRTAESSTMTQLPAFRYLSDLRSMGNQNSRPLPWPISDEDNSDLPEATSSPGPLADFEAHTLLAPILPKLEQLKAFTAESLPPPHRNVKANSHKEVLKSKVLAIGEFVLAATKGLEDGNTMEIRLCKHIAENYWPLPTISNTHMHIHEMYRNSIWKKACPSPPPLCPSPPPPPAEMSSITNTMTTTSEDSPPNESDMCLPKVPPVTKPLRSSDKIIDCNDMMAAARRYRGPLVTSPKSIHAKILARYQQQQQRQKRNEDRYKKGSGEEGLFSSLMESPASSSPSADSSANADAAEINSSPPGITRLASYGSSSSTSRPLLEGYDSDPGLEEAESPESSDMSPPPPHLKTVSEFMSTLNVSPYYQPVGSASTQDIENIDPNWKRSGYDEDLDKCEEIGSGINEVNAEETMNASGLWTTKPGSPKRRRLSPETGGEVIEGLEVVNRMDGGGMEWEGTQGHGCEMMGLQRDGVEEEKEEEMEMEEYQGPVIKFRESERDSQERKGG